MGVEIREYLIDWNETRDEVTEYFDELVEKRDRVKLTEKTLDEITNKLTKISKTFFDEEINATKDDLQKKSKEELVEYIVKSQWYFSGKQGIKQISQNVEDAMHKSMSLIDYPRGHQKSIDLKPKKPRNSAKLSFLSKK